MVDYNLITELDSSDPGLDAELSAMFTGGHADLDVDALIERQDEVFQPGSILSGRIVARAGDHFVVDVGLKSEGLIGVGEWEDPDSVDVGDDVQVWLETVESDSGHIVLSKRKADRILNWLPRVPARITSRHSPSGRYR